MVTMKACITKKNANKLLPLSPVVSVPPFFENCHVPGPFLCNIGLKNYDRLIGGCVRTKCQKTTKTSDVCTTKTKR